MNTHMPPHTSTKDCWCVDVSVYSKLHEHMHTTHLLFPFHFFPVFGQKEERRRKKKVEKQGKKRAGQIDREEG